jgi:hypothetical protein
MKEKELYEHLAGLGIRLFVVAIGRDKRTFIHPNKTTEEWRSDIMRFKTEISQQKDEDGYSDDNVYNELTKMLMDAGYHDVDDIASDVYEGRVAVYSAGLEDDPSHEEQADGFGHYGWESKSRI